MPTVPSKPGRTGFGNTCTLPCSSVASVAAPRYETSPASVAKKTSPVTGCISKSMILSDSSGVLRTVKCANCRTTSASKSHAPLRVPNHLRLPPSMRSAVTASSRSSCLPSKTGVMASMGWLPNTSLALKKYAAPRPVPAQICPCASFASAYTRLSGRPPCPETVFSSLLRLLAASKTQIPPAAKGIQA